MNRNCPTRCLSQMADGEGLLTRKSLKPDYIRLDIQMANRCPEVKKFQTSKNYKIAQIQSWHDLSQMSGISKKILSKNQMSTPLGLYLQDFVSLKTDGTLTSITS